MTLSTNTLYCTYDPEITDRGTIYAFFRQVPGFELIGFYEIYCFIRFSNVVYATRAIEFLQPPFGCHAYQPAKCSYIVPYPQPADHTLRPSQFLHLTHLPPNFTIREMINIMSIFPGLGENKNENRND